MKLQEARFLGGPPIDAYGNGGFRFADMSHRGSILLLPSGVHAWAPDNIAAVKSGDLEQVFREADAFELLLVGTGVTMSQLPEPVREALRDRGIRAEPMDTGAAARTYNVLLAEERLVAAALIAVD